MLFRLIILVFNVCLLFFSLSRLCLFLPLFNNFPEPSTRRRNRPETSIWGRFWPCVIWVGGEMKENDTITPDAIDGVILLAATAPAIKFLSTKAKDFSLQVSRFRKKARRETKKKQKNNPIMGIMQFVQGPRQVKNSVTSPLYFPSAVPFLKSLLCSSHYRHINMYRHDI